MQTIGNANFFRISFYTGNVVGLSQSTVSHHLRILVEAGLLSRTKRGIWSYYAIVPGSLEDLAGALTV